MWQGILGLKNDNCVVQMHFIAGCRPLVKLSLPQQGPDGTVQPLRIAQRMRLEQAQLDGVAKRMQVSGGFGSEFLSIRDTEFHEDYNCYCLG